MFICSNLKRLGLLNRAPLPSNLIRSMAEIIRNTENTIIEGAAEILVPEGQKVFYNPVQEFNRDLSVASLKLLSSKYLNKSKLKPEEPDSNGSACQSESVRVLEALSATGLRSIRYAKEVPGITEVIANDLSKSAVEIIERNIKHNKVDNIVKTSLNDACAVMFENRNSRFDAIDIDPYGCPSRFLDTAVQSVKDGGVLLVTCTDMAILCGNAPNTCYVQYGAVSLKTKACHEMALRIVLQHIQSHASRYKRYIVPLLSISADFYVRVIVRIYTSPIICKQVTSNLSMVYQCTGCETLSLQPLGCMKEEMSKCGQQSKITYSKPKAPAVGKECCHCGSGHTMGGPIWSAPIHDPTFVNELLEVVDVSNLATKARLKGVLSVVREELFDVPLYYSVDRLCSTVHATSIALVKFRSALMNAGFRVSLSHALPTSIKTDAPMAVLWDIVRTWVKDNPISEKKLASNKVAQQILSSPCTLDIDFKLRRDANPLSREMKLVRYQENPTRYWGPGSRAIVNVGKFDKQKRNQNKKRRMHGEVGDTTKVLKLEPPEIKIE